MPQTKAVIFDFIGTLANARQYTMQASLETLHRALTEAGFQTDKEAFLRAYGVAHEKYRLVRFGELREVTNAVWVSETLCSCGYDVEIEDGRLKEALNVFFKAYVDSLSLRPHAKKLLQTIKERCKVGLVSNFTYAPVVHAGIRKLGIAPYFNAVIVSHDCGYRKPHPTIFTTALERLGVSAQEAVFIGDCPAEDIKGALQAGIRTVFVESQFFKAADLEASGQKPQFAAKDLKEINQNLPKILMQ
jgi:putative hydrolase of the HAD superfamily